MLKKFLHNLRHLYLGRVGSQINNDKAEQNNLNKLSQFLDDDVQIQKQRDLYYKSIKDKIKDKNDFLNFGDQNVKVETNQQTNFAKEFINSQDQQEKINQNNKIENINIDQKLDINGLNIQSDNQINKTQNQQQQNKVHVPFMITRNMKLELIDLGYTIEQIKQMKPQQAQDIINKEQQC